MKPSLLIYSLIFLTPGCVKRSSCCEEPRPAMVRTQTQCADPWGYGSNNVESVDKLKHYLAEKSISVFSIELLSTGEMNTCAACTCSKGFAFHILTEPRFIDSLKKQGFVLK